MEFLFFCPSVRKTFESKDFKITDNKGIKSDANNNKYLDAKVVLTAPCPYCGKLHEFQAAELTCPFQR